MPVHNVCFRATCGLFLATYCSFMAKRVQFVMKMRVRTIAVRNKLDILLFVFVASYLLCCGDVEVNPGPVDSNSPTQQQIDQKEDSATARSDRGSVKISDFSSPSLSAANSGISPDVATQILETMRQVKADVDSIKTDINHVKTMCKDIGRRCDWLEEENERLSSSVKETKEDVHELFSACNQNEGNLTALHSEMAKMKNEVDSLKEHCDTLESFSRRDNLRLYGVPQTERFESYDTCARLIADTLNSVEAPKKWCEDDFVRAHRVGESRSGEPKPMIVKFSQWKDKMTVLTNREYRSRLEKKGVRVANDLTRRQAGIVAEARKEGKVAFFRRGKLTIGPRRLDSRTYAEVAATAAVDVTDTRETAPDTRMTTQLAADATGCRERRGRSDDPGKEEGHGRDSPHHSDDDRRFSGAQGTRDTDSGGRGSNTAEGKAFTQGEGRRSGGSFPHHSNGEGQPSSVRSARASAPGNRGNGSGQRQSGANSANVNQTRASQSSVDGRISTGSFSRPRRSTRSTR